MPLEPAQPSSWESIAADLRAYREQQRQTWGDLDHALIGRYLAGEVSEQERSRVETELTDHPELRVLTEVVSGVLADLEPIEEPRVLAYRPARVVRGVRRRQLGSLAAAACLLLGLGLALHHQTPPTRDTDDTLPVAAMHQSFFADSRADRVALASELVDRGDLDQAAHFLFTPSPQPKPVPADPRPYLRTVARLADKTLDRTPPPGDQPQLTGNVAAKSGPEPTSTNPYAPGAVAFAEVVPSSGNWILDNSLPPLAQGLRQKNDPELQVQCASVLGRMGPAARPVADVLEELAAKGCDRVQPVAQEALRHVRRPDWIGLSDSAHVLSERTRARIHTRLRELSQKCQVPIVAETVAALPVRDRKALALTEQARRRCREVGADHALYLYICMDPPGVQVRLCPEVEKKAAPAWRGDVAKARLEKSVAERQLDRGLEEVVQMLEQAIRK